VDHPTDERDGAGTVWLKSRLGTVIVALWVSLGMSLSAGGGALWALSVKVDKGDQRSRSARSEARRAMHEAEAAAALANPVELTRSITELKGSIEKLTAVVESAQRDNDRQDRANDRQDEEMRRLRDRFGAREKLLPADERPHSLYLRLRSGWTVGGGTHSPTGFMQRQPAAQS
jgi:hypothetical protein